MGLKLFQVAAITTASVGCVLFCVALASSSWLVGCLQYDSIFKALQNHPDTSEEVKTSVAVSSDILKGVSMCIRVGMYKFSMTAGWMMNVQSAIQFTSIPRYSLFGSFGMIFAVLASFFSVAFLIYAVSRHNSDYTEKSKASDYTRRAMILLVFAGIAGAIGMAIFTGGSYQAAHDPLMFMGTFGLAVQGSDIHQMTDAMSGKLPSLNGRGKRSIDIGSLGLDTQSENYISTMMNGLDPGYGYAFILGWVAVVVMLLAAVFAATARKYSFDHPYDAPSTMKL